MTDKVHKIREEVARIQLYTQSEVLKQVLDYIDEVQKEPVSMWHDASEEPKPNMELICVGQYGNPLVLSSNSDSFKSRDISKWAYFNDLLNLSNVQRTVKNWKEPVSDDLEEAASRYAKEEYRRKNPATLTDRCRGCYAPLMYAFKAGAQWQEEKDKSVTKDLGDYINELSKQFPEVSFAKLSRIAVRVAKWQKERDEDEIRIIRELLDNFDKTCDEYHDAGFKHGQEALMKDAVEAEIGSAGLLSPLYIEDYDKAKNYKYGDKVKLIIVKED